MDLGTYERMLDQNLSRLNFATSGQIYRRVLDSANAPAPTSVATCR
jgi:CTP synthase (UTP-ammonia lyase)